MSTAVPILKKKQTIFKLNIDHVIFGSDVIERVLK
jgi:hypothetical protein